MKTKSLFLFILVLLFFVQCDTGNKEGKGQDSEKVAEQPDTLKGKFYKHYFGKVGKEDAVFNLHCNDGWLKGNCYLKNSGRMYELMNYRRYDSTAHYIFYAELVGKMGENNDDSLEITFFKNGKMDGIWFTKGGEKGITGKEDYDHGSYMFTPLEINDSLELDTGNLSNDATISYALLQLDGQYEDVKTTMVTDGNAELLGCKHGIKIKGCIRQHIDSFLADYRSSMYNMLKETYSETNDYYENYDEYVNYNEKGIVSLELVSSSYTGGAHGYYFSRFYNADLQNNRRIILSDAIKPDTIALRAIIEAEARRYFNIGKDTPLKAFLLVGTIPYTNNFYITGRGLVFSYAPYEIAAYVFGQVNILVPYDKLRNLLQPGFAKRIELSK